MNKFNRQFNSKVKRLNKWHDVLMRLSAFEGIVNSYDGLTSDDVRDLRSIHKKLYECQEIAKRRYNNTMKGLIPKNGNQSKKGEINFER